MDDLRKSTQTVLDRTQKEHDSQMAALRHKMEAKIDEIRRKESKS